MSHKILIELDPEAEAVLRDIAETDQVSMSYAASRVFGHFLKKLKFYLPDMKAEIESEEQK